MGKQRKQWETLFSWAPKSLQMVTAAIKASFEACSLEDQCRQHRTAKRSNQSNPKINQSWILTGRTDAEVETAILTTWCKKPTHWKRPWFWARLKAGGEGNDRGQDGWMASQTRWTWVWANSGSWWWTWKPGVLHSMGSQRVGHNWVTEQLNWTDVVSCKVWTVVSRPTYRFLRRQKRWSGISISLRIFHCFLWSTQSKALV